MRTYARARTYVCLYVAHIMKPWMNLVNLSKPKSWSCSVSLVAPENIPTAQIYQLGKRGDRPGELPTVRRRYPTDKVRNGARPRGPGTSERDLPAYVSVRRPLSRASKWTSRCWPRAGLEREGDEGGRAVVQRAALLLCSPWQPKHAISRKNAGRHSAAIRSKIVCVRASLHTLLLLPFLQMLSDIRSHK